MGIKLGNGLVQLEATTVLMQEDQEDLMEALCLHHESKPYK